MGGLDDPPLKDMSHEDWEQLKKVQAGFQDISTHLAERMYMPYKGPCVDTDPGPIKPLGKNLKDKQGNEIEETAEGKAKLDVMTKISKSAGTQEQLKEIDKSQKEENCMKPLVLDSEAKAKADRHKRHRRGSKEEEKNDDMMHAFRMLKEDPARYFATVPESEIRKMKPLVEKLRKISHNELPNATDEDPEKPPVDGATRYRYELVMQEMRDLADRTMLDMLRCRNVRPSHEILNMKEGSKAQNIRMGLQEDTMIYEREMPVIPEKKKKSGGSSCAVM
jgi:hypothetical protein